MKYKDFITVGIIARNEEKSIGNTLKYLIKQSYPNELFEIIIVDGNSSDKTKEIAKNILAKSDIQYKILNEVDFKSIYGFNFGPCFARNLVIKNSNSKAKYVAWIDADCRADIKWLENLYNCIKKIEKNDNIAGAGGPRLVEKNKVSKKELVFNYYFTSCIISLNNPAFCNKGLSTCKNKICYMGSVAGYNSIYKKSILDKYMYDEKLVITDDVEINYRITKDGYNFILCPKAKIYHRETSNFFQFIENMFRYGINIGNAIRKHKNIIRLYVPVAIGYFFYTILLPILIYLSYIFFGNLYIPLIPYFIILLISLIVFIENVKKTKSLWSLLVISLVFIHLFAYGLGVILNLLRLKGYFRK